MIREGLKLPQDVKTRIPELIKALSARGDVIALYACGGLAQNELNPLSDLDFGILLSNRSDKQERYDLHLELIGLFTAVLKTDEIDLILLNDAPYRIAFKILQTGSLMFLSQKDKLIDFRERTVKLYLDFKFFRDSFDDVFIKGIGYNG